MSLPCRIVAAKLGEVRIKEFTVTEKKTEWSVSVGDVTIGRSDGQSHLSIDGISIPMGGGSQAKPMGSQTLASMGVVTQKIIQTGGAIAAGAMSGQEVTRYNMRLPVSPRLQANFRKESWGDSLVKVFKKELQTGDAEFDKLVYISTDTPTRTQAFLTREMRNAIAYMLDTGGSLEINNEEVSAVSGGIDAPDQDDQTVLKLVRALLEFASTP